MSKTSLSHGLIRNLVIAASSVAVAATVPCAFAQSGTRTWIGGGGLWDVGAGWLPVGVPTGTDEVIIAGSPQLVDGGSGSSFRARLGTGVGQGALVTVIGAQWSNVNVINAGDAAGSNGRIEVSFGGKVASSGLVLGAAQDSTGSIQVKDPGSKYSGALTIGDLGPGGMVVEAEGEVASAGIGTARSYHTATLLLDGRVLVAGGVRGSTYLASAELYDAGLGFPASRQPQINSASFDATGRLVLTGTGFLGVTGASGGNGSQDSPTNFPFVELRLLSNEQSAFLAPDPAVAISDTSFASVPVAPYSGHAEVRVFVNGIPSAAVFPTGDELSFTRDTDGDGLSDAAEFQLGSLGFDWSISQPELKNAMFSSLTAALPNLNDAGLYTESQIQALHVGTPLIQRDSLSGLFKLTIAVSKAPDLMNFAPFPMTGPQTSINGQGKLEFEFPSFDNAAFLPGVRVSGQHEPQ